MLNQEELTQKYRLSELNDILMRCEDEIEKKIKEKEIKESNDNINFLLYTIGKSFVSTREVIMLCWSGFPDGALSISRNIFEQFIITAYIESKIDTPYINQLFERYDDDYSVKRAKALKFEAEHVNVNSQKEAEYDEKIKEIKEKYGLRSLSDYWWTEESGMTFSTLCDYVAEQNASMKQFIRLMQFLYKRACLSLHASNMGNRIRVGSDNQQIDMGPWDEGQENALFETTSSLIFIVGMTFYVLKIDDEDITKHLNELAMFYHNQIRERTNKLYGKSKTDEE